MYVIGVDGCLGGWLATRYDPSGVDLTYQVFSSFQQLLARHPDAACIAVDIPIGLSDGPPRLCDVEARRALGPRRSSVFPAPQSRLVGIPSYPEALALSRTLYDKGISRQAFGIYPKIAEVNAIMTPQLQARVVEVHPEVSFWALNGYRPMDYPKRSTEGYEERRDLILKTLGGSLPARAQAGRAVRGAGADDLLDATVAAWSARRFAEGRAGRMPTEPPTDARGLRMEMVY
ncbi:MAG: DUF429 domain-containing protein [Chloroflexota bacterium]|nr:DUF429 domain-containing protein [Chloroflexota bacterium]